MAYVDADGAVQTLSTDVYAVETATLVGLISLKYDQVWPETRSESYAVRIAFTAGYGAASTVPEPLKWAIKLLIGHWYAHRDQSMEVPRNMAFAVDALIAPYRLNRI